MKARKASIKRKTSETDITVEVNLDGTGKYKVDTGLPFMNHMLELSPDENLTSLYDNAQDLIMELTKFLFYGVLDREVHT